LKPNKPKHFYLLMIALITILSMIAYWIIDSIWAINIYKADLQYLMTHPPKSLINELFYNVSPYRSTSRLIVFIIISLLGIGTSVLYCIKDKAINKIRKVEKEQLRLTRIAQRAKRMETVGLLASGVAHDLNNVLSGVTTYPELIISSLDKDDPMYEHLALILDAGKKAAKIVEDLSFLSKSSVPYNQTIDLNKIIKEFITSNAVTQKIPKHITLKTYLTSKPSFITGSEIHMYKLLLNLILNSIEAIGTKPGEIKIITKHRKVTEELKEKTGIKTNNALVLMVRDSGPGIPKEFIEHIFEPFFTKDRLGETGDGTGLGLTIVWNIIKDHSGHIDIESSIEGTTFLIYFPLNEKAVKKHKKRSEEIIKGTNEKILIVDDNNIQRTTLKSLLKLANYEVDVANNGEEALQKIEKGNKYELIILDVYMPPGMTGCQTFSKIKKIIPTQKAIITSGYIDSDRLESAKKLGIKHFIIKPYSIFDISKIINDVLTNKY